jgi:hypothetical protein
MSFFGGSYGASIPFIRSARSRWLLWSREVGTFSRDRVLSIIVAIFLTPEALPTSNTDIGYIFHSECFMINTIGSANCKRLEA